MKIVAMFLGCLALVSTSVSDEECNQSSGSWAENGKIAPDVENRASKDGFGVLMYVIDDESFFDDWNKPQSPHIPVITEVTRNKKKPRYLHLFRRRCA